MSIKHRVLAEKKLAKSEAKKLAAEYLRIHNEAAQKYKKAFASVGAKMWHDDAAHTLKGFNVDRFADKLMTFPNWKKIWGTYDRPLTRLDSYPKIANDPKKMKELDLAVDKIWRDSNSEWKKIYTGG